MKIVKAVDDGIEEMNARERATHRRQMTSLSNLSADLPDFSAFHAHSARPFTRPWATCARRSSSRMTTASASI